MKNAQADHPLKIWRLKQRPPLTQAQLAQKVGVSDMSISLYEDGRTPRPRVLAALCALTRLKISDFYPKPAIPAGSKKESVTHGK